MIIRTRFVKSSMALIGLCLLSSCSGGGVAPIRYYVIDAVEQVPLESTEVEKMRAVKIVDLHIPHYLEKFQIAKRVGSNEMVFSDNHQWGEDLRKNLLRSLSRNLSSLLGTPDVATPLNRSSSEAQTEITVFIEEFDQDSAGFVNLHARYQIRNNKGDVLTTKMFVDVNENPSPNNYASMVAVMQGLFSNLSHSIALSALHERVSKK